ncbi:MAG: sensor histidine kinase [Oscillospiraceae bacterium]
MLLNLIANSNKNTQEGEICVFALQQKNHVQISVEDTGDGIEDEIFPYIFERGTSGNDGNGIGLFLCREVIQTHGGLIWAENLELGGCRVSFTLPVA